MENIDSKKIVFTDVAGFMELLANLFGIDDDIEHSINYVQELKNKINIVKVSSRDTYKKYKEDFLELDSICNFYLRILHGKFIIAAKQNVDPAFKIRDICKKIDNR